MAHEERAHSLRSPSKAPIYTRCPGAPRLWTTIPEGKRESSEAARLGTAKHTLAEMCQTTGMAAADFIGEVIEVEGYSYPVDDEFASDVQLAVEMVSEIIGSDDGKMLMEIRVHLDGVVGPGESGLVDLAYVSEPRKTLFILDYKFGRKKVAAANNPSLLLYAKGLVDHLKLDATAIEGYQFVLGICQPVQGTPSVWTLTGAEFLQEVSQLREQCEKTYEQDAPLNMGDHCFFCAAKAICPEMMKQVGSAVFDDPEFSNLDAAVDPDAHSPEQAARILKALPAIKQWLETFEEHWKTRWMDGTDIPGLKLIEGRKGARQWTDKAQVEDLLANKFRIPAKEMYTQAILSPSAAEKLLAEKSPRRWAQLQALVKQSQSAPSFVPETAAKPAMPRSTDDHPFA